jgi:excisionase family DNA binding protein
MLCNAVRLDAIVVESTALLNTKEAARFLRVSEASVRRWSDAGLLPARRVGRRRERRFGQDDLVGFLGQPERHAQHAAAEPVGVIVGGVLLPPSTHIAPIYSTDLGGLRLAVPFLADGMRAGQPCFLVAHGETLDRYAMAFRHDQGIDFDAAVRHGQLRLLEGPGERVAEAIGNWERLFGDALAFGPAVIRVVGELARERSKFVTEAEMMAYEEAYDVMVRRFPVVTLCQYDAREFSGDTLLRVLKSHPDMFAQNLGRFLN